MDLFFKFSDAFWNEDFWLPPNVTWKDIEPGSHGINHADYKDLVWPLPIAFILLFIRFLCERKFFLPIGKYLGIKSNREIPPPWNQILELAYKSKSKLDDVMTLKLSKQLDVENREIERWWRRRRAQDKPTALEKFCENCWRCLFYLFSFSFGLSVLWDKNYLWNILHCAYGYPHHGVSRGVWLYYMVSLAFYWSLMFSQFLDNKRKDFWQMFTHHVLTLLLMSLSWVCNIHRVGSLIILVHDCADIFLEAAKSFKYAKLQKLCDLAFGIFAITWIVTRLIIFPRILFACLFQTQQPFYPVYFLFNALLITLFILHCKWSYMIYQVIEKSFITGKDGVKGDVRSSSEDD